MEPFEKGNDNHISDHVHDAVIAHKRGWGERGLEGSGKGVGNNIFGKEWGEQDRGVCDLDDGRIVENLLDPVARDVSCDGPHGEIENGAFPKEDMSIFCGDKEPLYDRIKNGRKS